jgi:hypothetical protein
MGTFRPRCDWIASQPAPDESGSLDRRSPLAPGASSRGGCATGFTQPVACQNRGMRPATAVVMFVLAALIVGGFIGWWFWVQDLAG